MCGRLEILLHDTNIMELEILSWAVKDLQQLHSARAVHYVA